MKLTITIERTPTQVSIYSLDPMIFVARDPHVSERELLQAFADAFELHRKAEADLLHS
jgi:hypothetical protein